MGNILLDKVAENLTLEDYLAEVFRYQGKVSMMMNSFDISFKYCLSLKNSSIKGSFKSRLKRFVVLARSIKDKLSFNFENFESALLELNDFWDVTKHGTIIGGQEDVIRFYYDENVILVDDKKIVEIDELFSKTISQCTEIHNLLLSCSN